MTTVSSVKSYVEYLDENNIILHTVNCSDISINLNRNIIGKGIAGIVYKAESEAKKVYAVKIITFDNDKPHLSEEKMITEINITSIANPKYFKEAIVDSNKSKIYIITKYYGGGDLLNFITRNEYNFNIELIIKKLKFISQMISQVVQMQRNNIIHRDIKLANFILNKEQNKVLLIDYGISCKLDSEKETEKCDLSWNGGTPKQQTEERIKIIIDKANLSLAEKIPDFMKKEDLYALSITIISMFQKLYHSFKPTSNKTFYSDLVKQKIKPFNCFASRDRIFELFRERFDNENYLYFKANINDLFNLIGRISNIMKIDVNLEDLYEELLNKIKFIDLI